MNNDEGKFPLIMYYQRNYIITCTLAYSLLKLCRNISNNSCENIFCWKKNREAKRSFPVWHVPTDQLTREDHSWPCHPSVMGRHRITDVMLSRSMSHGELIAAVDQRNRTGRWQTRKPAPRARSQPNRPILLLILLLPVLIIFFFFIWSYRVVAPDYYWCFWCSKTPNSYICFSVFHVLSCFVLWLSHLFVYCIDLINLF